MFLTQKPKGQVGSTMKNLKMCFLYVPSSLFVGGNNPFESEIFFFFNQASTLFILQLIVIANFLKSNPWYNNRVLCI